MASNTFSETSEKYSFFTEYSREDIEKVKILEDEEQKRRIEDVAGEKQRRELAIQASEIFSSNIRPTWFQKGSSYVIKLLGVARNAGNNILRSSQIKLQVAGQKGIATAQDVKQRVAVAGLKAQEASIETAHDVKDVLQEKFGNAQDVLQEKLGSAQGALKVKVGSAQDVLQEKFGSAQDVAIEKVHEVAQKIKGLSLKWFGKVNKAISTLSTNTNLAFAVLEEENERVYRMNSDIELYAMMNAYNVAQLFKELAPAFYRPTSEPSKLYFTKMLEGRERARRNLRDLHDRTAINNAKAVATLIEHKHRVSMPVAALVAAKAEIVEEIKVSKPILPATM